MLDRVDAVCVGVCWAFLTGQGSITPEDKHCLIPADGCAACLTTSVLSVLAVLLVVASATAHVCVIQVSLAF